MQIGKVPENILKRAVLQQLHQRRREVILSPGVGEDCSAISVGEGEALVFSVDPITGTDKGIGRLAVHITANDLASAGAEPICLMTSIIMPPGTREIRLRELMQEMEETCAALNIEIAGGHTEISDAVNRTVVTVTGIGKVKKDFLVRTGGLQPGDELVMTKWAGLEGTAIIAAEKGEKLLETLPKELVEEAASFIQRISVLPEAAIAAKMGVSAMHDVTEGGVFGALWEMGAAAGVGITVDLMKIPIRQETVEVCEIFAINPYRMMSGGSLLIGCRQGNLLAENLHRAGIPAAVIGRANDSNDRIVLHGEDAHYLEPPGSDELYKIYEIQQ